MNREAKNGMHARIQAYATTTTVSYSRRLVIHTDDRYKFLKCYGSATIIVIA